MMSPFRNNVIILTAVLGLFTTGCSKKEAPAGTGTGGAIAASNAWLAVIQYRTSFENKANAVETVTPMRDPDGVYRVSGYYIR
jgi:hypothetical protein